MTTVRAKKTPVPTRTYEIHGKEIFVFDGLFSAADVRRLERDVTGLDFVREHNPHLWRGYSEWAAHFPIAEARRHLVVRKTEQLLRGLFPLVRFRLIRSYCKHLGYGDLLYPHRDIARDKPIVVTAVYYPNRTWDYRWGGETIFYANDRDARVAVSPRAGRLVLFRASILHAAGVPARTCPHPRYTLVYKFRGTRLRPPR